MRVFVRRMVGAALFDDRTYEEVEADRHATAQALGVVVLSSLATGVGWIGTGPDRLGSVAVLTAAAVLAWIGWATLVYVIGTSLLPQPQTRADVGELLRTLGYAQSPGVLRALGAVPVVGSAATAVVMLWTLATMVVAVRHALDYQSTARAIVVCVTGWLLSLLMFAVIGLIFAPVVS